MPPLYLVRSRIWLSRDNNQDGTVFPGFCQMKRCGNDLSLVTDDRAEDQLTRAEQDELESVVRANTLLGILKTEAHASLAHTKTA